MNEDRVAGNAKVLGGKLEQSVGRATGDAKTQVEGAIDEAAGHAQDLYGQARDAAAEAAEAVGEQTQRAEDAIREFVETRPYATAVLALCAGWLIGRMGRRYD
jgi:uncharacterized protein YjbJ (UPF0337 family)